MPDIEEPDSDHEDKVTEQTPARPPQQRHSVISSEGEGSQWRRSTASSRKGLSLSKSLRRRYLLCIGLAVVGVMLAIVVLGVMGAMASGGGEEGAESTTDVTVTEAAIEQQSASAPHIEGEATPEAPSGEPPTTISSQDQ